MITKIINDIGMIASELASGNIAGIPTETVYGLGANALNGIAVAKIYETKDRPKFNPIIVHVKGIDEFENFGKDIPEDVYKLAERYSPGPITFIVRKKEIIPDIVTAGNDSVGLRIPRHPLFLELLAQTGFPVAAPSANMFGKISPTSAEETLSELEGKIRFILDGGKCEVGIESTVISFVGDVPKILRYGAVTSEEIKKVIGKIKSGKGEKIISPGMTESHYAPRKPMFIIDSDPDEQEMKDLNAVFLDLHKFGDPLSMAVNLFSEMRRLDESDCGIILCRKIEDKGIGVAINDKLERASTGKFRVENGVPVITKLKYA